MNDEDMRELKLIVEYLNVKPFFFELALVELFNKSKLELHQLVNDIFGYINPKMKADLREGDPQANMQRMIEFALGALGYQFDAAEFTEKFVAGDKTVVFPFMYWVLDQRELLSKRAYLARFLQTIVIPEEMFADKNVVALFQEHSALQDQFKEEHQQAEAVRSTSQDPMAVQAEIEQLAHEAEQLKNKLASTTAKAAELDQDEFKEVLACTHELRLAQETQSKWHLALQEENDKLGLAQENHAEAKASLRRLKESRLERESPQRLIAKQRQEIAALEAQTTVSLPQEEAEKKKVLRELESVISSKPMTEEQVKSLTRETENLLAAVDGLKATRDRMLSSADGQMDFFRDRAAAMERKKEQLADQLQELEDDRLDAQTDLQQLEADLKALSVGGEMPKTDSEMKVYMKGLTKKTDEYRTKKSELQQARDEVAVLVRTEEVLRSRDENISEFNAQLAEEKGVSGFQETQDGLEAVASSKQAIDMSKGDTLDRMSQTVEQITKTLKAKKNKLAPIIKELRAVRHAFEEVEDVYKKKKKIYDNTALGLESERLKLEQDVEGNVTGILEEESAFHFLNCLSLITQVNLDLMALETKYQYGDGDRLSEAHKSYREMYEKTITQQEELAKKLRQDKAQITEQHGDNIQQRSLFLDLRKIMTCKAEMQKKKLAVAHEEENRLVFGDANGERMVIE